MTKFNNILFVVEDKIDFNTFEHAIRLAKSQNAKITFMDAIEKPPMWAVTEAAQKTWDVKFEGLLANRKRLLDGAVKPHRDKLDISINVIEGKIYLETVRAVLSNDYDLVIKYADASKSIASRIFGAQDMRILRNCPCPVLITHPYWDGEFKHILAAVDFQNPNDIDAVNTGNQLNRNILETAIMMASQKGGNVDVIHVFQVPGAGIPLDSKFGEIEYETATYIANRLPAYQHLLDQLIEKAKKWVGRDVSAKTEIMTYVKAGKPTQEIPNQSRRLQSDLIVMGTVGRGGVSGMLFGNTAEEILGRIECSVLALKPEGFISPIKLEQ